VFDKTGTLTRGEPEVTDVWVVPPYSEENLLFWAAAVEKNSEHPLAEAVLKKADRMNINPERAVNFIAVEGQGVQGTVSGKKVLIGNSRFLKKNKIEVDNLKEQIRKLADSGKSVIFIAVDGTFIGVMAVTDPVKPDSKKAVSELKQMGIQVVMLTGDNPETAEAIGKETGIGRIFSEVLPGDKISEIQKLQSEKKTVAMVGDGINDAPALVQADLGIALGSGTDIAMEASDITLIKGSVSGVVSAVKLSRKTIRVIKQNLFWAFFYNTIGIPVAAGVLYPFFQILLDPVFAAAAMAFSSVSVVSNSLRLRRAAKKI
jgi:Cu+-exporting ATPase